MRVGQYRSRTFAGFTMLIILATLGVPVYLLPKFRATTTSLDAIEQRRPMIFIGVPAMYRMMLDAGAEQHDLASVRTLWSSGADTLSDDIAAQLQRKGAAFTVPAVPSLPRPGDVHRRIRQRGTRRRCRAPAYSLLSDLRSAAGYGRSPRQSRDASSTTTAPTYKGGERSEGYATSAARVSSAATTPPTRTPPKRSPPTVGCTPVTFRAHNGTDSSSSLAARRTSYERGGLKDLNRRG